MKWRSWKRGDLVRGAKFVEGGLQGPPPPPPTVQLGLKVMLEVSHIPKINGSLSKVTNYEMSMFGSVIWNKVD